MYISPEVLRGLGIFQPSGLADELRVDETHVPFWAIDCPRPEETDDAIRVSRRKNGGFIVEVAMADGSQLNESPDIIDRALMTGPSQYFPAGPRMLPPEVIVQLELKHATSRRALLMRQFLDKDMQPEGEVSFRPAHVIANCMTFESLGKKFVKDSEHFGPLETVAREHGIETRPSKNGSAYDIYHLKKIGSNTVSFYMRMTNTLFASWAHEREIPIINRGYDPDLLETAYYADSPVTHQGITSSQPVSYAQISSQLRRPGDLVNALNTGAFFTNQEYMFQQESLQSIINGAAPQYTKS